MRIIIKSIILLLFLLVINQQSFAQCCAAGSPSTTNNLASDAENGIFNFSLSHRYSFSDTYYKGTQITDYQYYKNSNYNFTNFLLSYSFSKNLSASGEIGYFENKSFVIPISVSQDYNIKSKGFADAMFSLNYRLYYSEKFKFSVSTFEKFTLPVGQFGVEQDGVILPIDIQPSSGSFRFAQGLILSKTFRNDKLSLYSVNMYESSQRIESVNYKYGDLWMFSMGGNYQISKRLSAKLMFRTMHRTQSFDFKQKESLQKITASGGDYFYSIPEISYQPNPNYSLSLLAEIPLYRNLNGTQMANKYAIELKMSAKIDFSPEIPDSLLFKTTFSVYGACEMCKERIEKTALKFPGIKKAYWNSETNVLYVEAKKEFDVEKLKMKLAKVGHDSDTQKADDKVYNALPACCHYRTVQP